jgi:hypothetical protein
MTGCSALMAAKDFFVRAERDLGKALSHGKRVG